MLFSLTLSFLLLGCCGWTSLHCFFFFFQAEDGIRDDLVTGVQTCALPICEEPVTAKVIYEETRRLSLVVEEHHRFDNRPGKDWNIFRDGLPYQCGGRARH